MDNRDILEKVKAEIETEMSYYANVKDKGMTAWCTAKKSGLNRALEIVNKYINKCIKENT